MRWRSERDPHAAEYLQGGGRAEELIVYTWTIGVSGYRNAGRAYAGGVAEDSPGRVLAVEKIVDRGKELAARPGFKGRVQVRRPVARNRRELVGLIAHVVETTHPVHGGAGRPVGQDLIVRARLDAVLRNPAQMVTGLHLDVAGRVLEGI